MKKLSIILCAISVLQIAHTEINAAAIEPIEIQPYETVVTGHHVIEYTNNGTGFNRTSTYYDGLGRTSQQIAVGASPSGKDIVAVTLYDCMGRSDSISYLPYAVSGNGSMRTGIRAEQQAFFQSYTNNSSDANYAYSLNHYDDSPAGFIDQVSSPGVYHSANSSLGHPVTMARDMNSLRTLPKTANLSLILKSPADSIKKFTISGNRLKYLGLYPDRTLTVVSRRVESSPGVKIIEREYTDYNGQVVAKTQRINENQVRYTHYVYDDFGNLRYIIPHIVYSYFLLTGMSFTPEQFDQYWIYYNYDTNGDRIEVYNPGQEPIYYVYDNRHRPVLSQDGNQRAKNQWFYTKYDDYDRVLQTSLITTTASADNIRSSLVDKNGYDIDKAVESLATKILCLSSTQYGDYADYEMRPKSSRPSITATNNNTVSENAASGLSDGSIEPIKPIDPPIGPIGPIIPIDTTGIIEIAKEKYYLTFIMPEYLSFQSVENIVTADDLSNENTGLKIYEKLGILPQIEQDAAAYIERALYYDKKGQLIQSVEKNHLKGFTRISYKYDFVGNVTAAHESYQSGNNANEDIKITYFTYDNFGRLLSESTTLNDSQEATMAYRYDDLGRQNRIIYGDSVLCTDFSYDMTGRVIGQDNEAFSMDLRYENPLMTGTEANYTGMVTECTWHQKGMTAGPQTYAYSYTPRGQYAGVHHYSGNTKTDKYIEHDIQYDVNDNILTLKRAENGGLLHNFTYAYTGNQLTTLYNGTDTRQFQYDANGNMTFDSQFDLHFEYNCLNLTNRIYNGIESCTYSYLSDGTKLKALNAANHGNIYLGSLIYRRNADGLSLYDTGFAGGKIIKTSNGYAINYYVTDFQGSVRTIVDEQGEIIECNDYYPLGARWDAAQYPRIDNSYLFNGKELQANTLFNLLDYGARMYNPYIGRWFCADPAMQLFNPYVFCGNNPVAYYDQDGRFFGWLLLGAALIGGYLGGSAANDNWNPFQWDWTSGKTWGGFIGGAIQGAISFTIGGMSTIYGLSAFQFSTSFFGRILRVSTFLLNTVKFVSTAASFINNFSNAMDIWRGNYLYSSKTFGGKVLQGLSRATWERAQQYLGYSYAHMRNGFDQVDVRYFYGALVVNKNSSLIKADEEGHKHFFGATLGNVINGWGIDHDSDPMLYHEYGHTIQSRIFGPGYLYHASASLINMGTHKGRHFRFHIERQANRYAKSYFGEDIWNKIMIESGKDSHYPTYK